MINNIFPIGIGTFRIDLNNKEESMNGLVHSFELGQNYIDTSFLYENGKVLKFLGDFFKVVGRENLFISTKLEKYIENVSDVEKQLDTYLELMDIEFVDCLQLHESAVSKIPLLELYEEMNRMVEIGKAKSLGISNVSLEELKLIHSKYKLKNFEGAYNLECKLYEDLGVIDYCKENNINFICYQPLRRNRTAMRNYPLLVELANKYNKTQNQIILNWIVKEKGINVILKSTTIKYIDENINSLNFEIEREDLNRLNEFRSKEFDSVEIDWNNEGGIPIHQLPNQFE